MSDSCCHGACDVHANEASAARAAADRRRVWRVCGGGALVLGGMVAGRLSAPAASIALYATAIAVSIWVPLRRAITSLRGLHLDINVLMVIAASGAAILGDWFEAASVLWLFSIAQWVEGRSMDRARSAIRSLLTLAPTQALVRRRAGEQLVDVAAVVPGDVVIVRPGERMPLDGFVVHGTSAVDQSPVTGEAMPVDKVPGDEVFAGTVNGTAALDVEVSRPSADSTIARIAHLVEQAQARRAPVQSLIDRFARRYTPIVVGLAIGLAVVPPLVAGGDVSTWIYRALTLLVVACPCALVISTPVSILSAVTAAAREGVLVKGGESLERLASIQCVAFDKTGTLTHGDIRVTDVLGVDGISSDGVLSVAAALEARSEHPIGRAIVMRAREDGVLVTPGQSYRALPGRGAEATVAELPAVVGNHRLFEERQLCTPSLHDRLERVAGVGGTPVLVSHDGSALGVIGLAHDARPGARRAIDDLRAEGVKRVVLLSGDSHGNASAAMTANGLDEAHGELMPADKERLIRLLRETYGPVAMVGDGLNDAPALAAADVGIAMGVAGTHAAIDTADVTLMADDLGKIAYAVRLARAALSNIRANVLTALALKLAFVALAAAGVATLWMAILADTGASLLVTANSLRLLKVRG